MVAAIGSSPANSVASQVGATTGGVDAQIAQYKKELSDCVSCASAKTPQGQAAIQAAAAKVSVAEARLEKIATEKSTNQRPDSKSATADKTFLTSEDTATTFNKNGFESTSAPTLSGSNLGSFVDVFA